MKIAVNTRFLIKNKLEGIGIFTKEALKQLVLSKPEHEFIFLFDRQYDQEFIFAENVKPIVVHPQARHPVLWYIWFNISVPWILKKIKPDIFISTDGFLPVTPGCKNLQIIHDIAFEHYSKDVPWLVSKYYRAFFPVFAHTANRIATVSEFTKNDIVSTYGIDPEKIDVIYNGASALFKSLNDITKVETRKELTEGAEYFIYVGALHSRKNIGMLLKSYDEFRRISEQNLKLVICGRKAWHTREMMEVYNNMQFRKDVIFTGRVSDEQLVKYLGSACALTYLSYFEGFGLPVLEAMYCDVPVITSNKSSLPEISGDAALLVNPENISEIALSMKNIAENPELRNRMIEKGRIQRQKFSWQQTARLLWESISKITT